LALGIAKAFSARISRATIVIVGRVVKRFVDVVLNAASGPTSPCGRSADFLRVKIVQALPGFLFCLLRGVGVVDGSFETASNAVRVLVWRYR